MQHDSKSKESLVIFVPQLEFYKFCQLQNMKNSGDFLINLFRFLILYILKKSMFILVNNEGNILVSEFENSILYFNFFKNGSNLICRLNNY